MNNYSTIKVICLLGTLAITVSYANAQVYNSGNLFIEASGSVYINDSLMHTASATYKNDGILYLAGNFNNSSTSLSGSGTTFMNGNNQLVDGTKPSTFGSMVVQNSSTVQLLQDAALTGSLTMGAINTVDINGRTLTVGNGFSGLGKLKGSYTSNLVAGGSGNIYFDHNAYYLKDFTINSGAGLALGDSLNIVAGTGFGTVIANGSLNSGGYLTLKSNSKGTARLGVSGDSIRGDVTIERYIPPRRAWRALCLPFKSSSQTIQQAWQEGVNNSNLNYANNQNPHPGFGMHITGNNNTSLGFDYNTTYNASILTWDQPSNDWTYTAPPTKTTNIMAYESYFTFVRGSRAVNLNYATSAPADSTILRARGILNFGSFNKTFTANTGSQFAVSNPYASSIDIATLISTAPGIVKNKFWVQDPLLAGDYGTGAYVTYSSGVMVPQSGSYPAPTTVIQGGQAFLLQSLGGTINIPFKEVYKTSSETNIFGFAPGSRKKPDPKVYINLLVATSNTPVLMDGVAEVYNDSFSDSVDWDDATKLNNFYENIALKRYNQYLAIETRPTPIKTDTMFIDLWGLKTRTYLIQTLPESIPAAVQEAWLIDNYLNTQTQINLTGETLYSFTPTSNSKTYSDRFAIVFTVNRKMRTQNQQLQKFSIAATNNSTGVVNIYPNPVSNGKATLTFTNMVDGIYEVSIVNNNGQKLFNKEITHSGEKVMYPLVVNKKWASGIYNVLIVNKQNHKVIQLSLVVS